MTRAVEPNPTALAAALREEAWPAVLEGLLAAWRATPHRTLADRLIQAGAKAAQDRPAPDDWDSAARKPDAAMLPVLLGTLLDKGSVKARPRLEALEQWPADPRIDRWVAAQYADPPFTSTGARPFWTRLAPLARRIQDAQARETLAKARAGYDLSVPWQEFLAGHLNRIQPALDAVSDADLSPEFMAVLDAIDQALREDAQASKPARAEDADALLSQVLTNPEDDEARAVLGDVLLEAGHPRGELLVIQLEATRSGPPSSTWRAAVTATSRRTKPCGRCTRLRRPTWASKRSPECRSWRHSRRAGGTPHGPKSPRTLAPSRSFERSMQPST